MKRSPMPARKKPMVRKSTAATKRKRVQRCSWGRCKGQRTPVVLSPEERYCKTHALVVADTLVGTWVKYVRDKQCVKCGTGEDLEWAHIHSRGMRYIRWTVGPSTEHPGNSVALCRKDHFVFTKQPAQWNVFLEQRWPGLWTMLVHQEIAGEIRGDGVDVAAVIIDFRKRLATT